jgi:hypothetical protein
MTTLEDLYKLNLAFCTKDDWYPDGLFWRDVDGEWVVRERGEKTNGKGDLISNTCMKIIFHDNKTAWAYLSLDAMKELLLDRRRWPIRMDQIGDSKNRIDCWWRKFLWWGGARPFKPHRWPNGMTRDPYIFFYAACVFLGKKEYIREVNIAWYTNRIGIAAWRQCLIEPTWWSEMLYREKKAHKHFYVTRLRDFRAYAYHNA